MFKKICSIILVLAVVTLFFGTIYATVQQDYRQSANDPQIQVAEDTANMLSNGGQIQEISALYPQVDFAQSLNTFIIVYDKTGAVTFSTGNINGTAPTLPLGVLASAQANGEDRLTWEPAPGVRVAAVVVPYANDNLSGYVLVARNIREVEDRETHLSVIVAIGWLLSVVLLAVAYIVRAV